MARKSPLTELAGIGNAAVKKATGNSWEDWLRILDKADAQDMSHRDIAAYLNRELNCPDWWSQMVTVGYEQARGLRQKYQKCTGEFAAGVSRTFNVPLERLYAVWEDPKVRKRWLKEGITVRKATKNKSMRIAWGKDDSSVDVNFYAAGDNKSRVSVDHRKLKSADDVAPAKAGWKDALERLQKTLASYG